MTYLENPLLQLSGNNLTIMMSHFTLPKFLQPFKTQTLRRIGGDNDGGYVIDERNISNSDLLIGLGMSDNWLFEKEFNDINYVPTYIYDGTVNLKVFLKKCRKYCIRINKPKIFIHWFKTSYNYLKFFRDNKYHIEKLVGIDSSPDFISLSTIFKEPAIKKYSRIFLKIDIEGSEYRLLSDLLKYSNKIEGLAIEFHDVDLHIDKIEEFISQFPLNLVHVHCNNYAPLSRTNIPFTVECSFSSEVVSKELVAILPNSMDMPNNPNLEDYKLTF